MFPTHEVSIEAPPEGLTGGEIAMRVMRDPKCPCSGGRTDLSIDAHVRGTWVQEDVRRRRYLPGETCRIQLFQLVNGKAMADQPRCTYLIELRKPTEDFDIIDAVNHDTKDFKHNVKVLL